MPRCCRRWACPARVCPGRNTRSRAGAGVSTPFTRGTTAPKRNKCVVTNPSVCSVCAVSALRVDGHQTGTGPSRSCRQLLQKLPRVVLVPPSITQVLPRMSPKSSLGCGTAQGHLCLLPRAPKCQNFPSPKCLLFSSGKSGII